MSRHIGKWGSVKDQDRLYHAAVVTGLYHWLLTPDGSRLECDDFKVGVSSGDSGKSLFVKTLVNQEIIKVRESILRNPSRVIFGHRTQFFRRYYSRVARMFSWRICLCRFVSSRSKQRKTSNVMGFLL